MSWLEEYRKALEHEAGTSLELEVDDVTAVLGLARDVPHGTERRFAPLATYLAGRFVARRTAQGTAPGTALEEARTLASGLLAKAAGEE
jgi:hypothetical protein